MKPLYLDGSAGMRVDLDDPALVVTVTDKSRRLFPLSRLSRITVFGHADWTMRALFACADAGIAVLFLGESGGVRGHWQGGVKPKANYLHHVFDLLQHADACSRYQNWLAGMQRMAVRSAARRFGIADWREAGSTGVNRWLQQNRTADNAVARRFFRSFILGLVTRFLSDAGLASPVTGCDGVFDLADDLAAILLWDFYPLLWSGQPAFGAAANKETLAAEFEQHRPRTEKLLRGLLNRLHDCLREPR